MRGWRARRRGDRGPEGRSSGGCGPEGRRAPGAGAGEGRAGRRRGPRGCRPVPAQLRRRGCGGRARARRREGSRPGRARWRVAPGDAEVGAVEVPAVEEAVGVDAGEHLVGLGVGGDGEGEEPGGQARAVGHQGRGADEHEGQAHPLGGGEHALEPGQASGGAVTWGIEPTRRPRWVGRQGPSTGRSGKAWRPGPPASAGRRALGGFPAAGRPARRPADGDHRLPAWSPRSRARLGPAPGRAARACPGRAGSLGRAGG